MGTLVSKPPQTRPQVSPNDPTKLFELPLDIFNGELLALLHPVAMNCLACTCQILNQKCKDSSVWKERHNKMEERMWQSLEKQLIFFWKETKEAIQYLEFHHEFRSTFMYLLQHSEEPTFLSHEVSLAEKKTMSKQISCFGVVKKGTCTLDTSHPNWKRSLGFKDIEEMDFWVGLFYSIKEEKFGLIITPCGTYKPSYRFGTKW